MPFYTSHHILRKTSYQRDHDVPVSSEDQHIVDVLVTKGKENSFGGDINIPPIVRGSGVLESEISEIATSHIDLPPTILCLVGAPLRAISDDKPVSLSKNSLTDAANACHEHAIVEYWAIAAFEGDIRLEPDRLNLNGMYQEVRVIS